MSTRTDGNFGQVPASPGALFDRTNSTTTAASQRCERSGCASYGSIPSSLSSSLDWAGIASAMNAVSLRRRRWIVKHNSDQCGVGRTLRRWGESTSAQCPRCAHPEEDTSHVLRCHGLRLDEIWHRSLKRLANRLRKARTDPELIAAIVTGLRAWHTHSLPTCHSDNPLLQAAFRTQQSIGWENCTRGFLALEWRATQQRYQESLLHDQYFSTKRWVSTLIQSLWDVAWDQWDYRNSVLHSPKHRPHQLLVQQLDAAISQEYQPNVAIANFPHPSVLSSGSRSPCYSTNLSDTANTGSTMWRQHATTPTPP